MLCSKQQDSPKSEGSLLQKPADSFPALLRFLLFFPWELAINQKVTKIPDEDSEAAQTK